MINEMIVSRENKFLKQIKKLEIGKKYRTEEKLFVCEGEKLFYEAVRSNYKILYAVWEQSAFLKVGEEIKEAVKTVHEYGCRILTVEEKLYNDISTLDTRPSVMFVCEMPKKQIIVKSGEGYLALDGVQDPGNVGTILRTADAFGMSVFMLNGCADVYNPKTIRATMGSLFRVPFEYVMPEEYFKRMKDGKITVYATALSDKSVDLTKVKLGCASVIIGSEGSGVSQEMMLGADMSVILPMKGVTESLNAAAAASIVMWEMSKKCQ